MELPGPKTRIEHTFARIGDNDSQSNAFKQRPAHISRDRSIVNIVVIADQQLRILELQKMSFKFRIIAVPLLVIVVGVLETQVTAVQQYNSNYIVEVIGSTPKAQGAFGTFWCKETQSLYYCDTFTLINCSLIHYIPAENNTYCATVQNFPYIYFIIPIEGKPQGKPGHFAVATNKTLEEIEWDGRSPFTRWIRTIITVETCAEFESNTFAGAKADQHGRLFAGTRRDEICFNLDTVPTYANLFRIYCHERPYTLNKPETLRFSSGIAWDFGKNKFYHVESCDWNIKSFDYCQYTGDICEFHIHIPCFGIKLNFLIVLQGTNVLFTTIPTAENHQLIF